jgi:hypothetical protein
MSSYSQYFETAILGLITGKTAYTLPSVWVALTTTTPTSASTGATIVEATYTGYARKSTAGSDWNAPVAGSPSSITNANPITFAACTGSTSTVQSFALVDNASTGAGNMLGWGTCASTVISVTQTPATFAAGALTVTST